MLGWVLIICLIGLLSHQSDFESILTLGLKIRLSFQSLFEFFWTILIYNSLLPAGIYVYIFLSIVDFYGDFRLVEKIAF